MDNQDLLADAITKGLAYQENGGKLDLNKTSAGQSGEMKSIFQYTPETWKSYSKQVFGKEVPMTNDNETYVTKQKVLSWIQDGKNTSQIASMWNAGESHPDAYKENWRGTNSHGVKYDTPTYAKNVLKYAKKFYNEKLQESNTNSTTQVTPTTPVTQTPSLPNQEQPQDISASQQNNGIMGQLIKKMS